MRLDSLDEILRFAIRKEADAAAFYRMVADRSNPGSKEAFEELAKEEEGHKKRLENFEEEAGKVIFEVKRSFTKEEEDETEQPR